MFKEILDSFNVMSVEDKRDAVNNELVYLCLLYEKLCTMKNVEYRKILDDEMKNILKQNETEDDFLNSVFVYVESLKEMMGSLLEQEQGV